MTFDPCPGADTTRLAGRGGGTASLRDLRDNDCTRDGNSLCPRSCRPLRCRVPPRGPRGSLRLPGSSSGGRRRAVRRDACHILSRVFPRDHTLLRRGEGSRRRCRGLGQDCAPHPDSPGAAPGRRLICIVSL
ncbi:hypothetical protein FOCC_FOCC004157 [Frankliniella occidentalis]|nr:hypothetical protein FOCC_FOCC004157 [Frankliniella occidentalis]